MPDVLDPKEIEALLMGGESSRGNFRLKEEPKHEEVTEQVIVVGRVKESLGKYKDDMLDKVRKNPEAYTIMTPKGRMSLQKALGMGYNPKTGQFDKPDIQQKKDEIMKRQNPKNKEALERVTNPKNAGLPEDQAEEMGFDKNSKFVKKNPRKEIPVPTETKAPEAEPEGEQMDPAMLQAMMGGGM